jgi:Tfp pilus assembly protein PilN
MPAEQTTTVNLLEHSSLEESPIGRIVTWATTYGRYIMITTEIIVLLAFISRFSLDRKRADLDEAIESKKAIIEANAGFEKQYRQIQAELVRAKSLLAVQNLPLERLTLLKSLLPSDTYLESFEYTPEKIMIRGRAGSNHGFTVLINNLQGVKQFQQIEVGEIKKTPTLGITFQVTISTQPPKAARQEIKLEEKI